MTAIRFCASAPAALAACGLSATPLAAQTPRGPVDRSATMPDAPATDASALDRPAGTVGRIAKFTSSTNLGNSVLREKDGRVGIGLASPPTLFSIKTPPRSYGYTHTDGTVSLVTFAGAGDVDPAGGWLGTRSNHPLHFFTNNGRARMTVGTKGYVGIGTPPDSVGALTVEAFDGATDAIKGSTTMPAGYGV